MIIKREFMTNLKSLIIWTMIISGLMFLILSMYSDFADKQEQMDALLSSYPEGMRKAFNIGVLDFSTALKYYAIEGYMLVTLFGSIYAAMLGASIVAREEQEKTIEFLLSKPITRFEIISQKLVAVLLNITLFNLFLTAVIGVGLALNEENGIEMELFTLMSIAPFLLHLTFAAFSFFLSAVFRKSRSVSSISLGIVLIAYFLSIVAALSDKFDKLKYITPFEYINAADIITDKALNPLYVTIMITIIIASIGFAYFVYQRKNL